jgi:hypothetical protein
MTRNAPHSLRAFSDAPNRSNDKAGAQQPAQIGLSVDVQVLSAGPFGTKFGKKLQLELNMGKVCGWN